MPPDDLSLSFMGMKQKKIIENWWISEMLFFQIGEFWIFKKCSCFCSNEHKFVSIKATLPKNFDVLSADSTCRIY